MQSCSHSTQLFANGSLSSDDRRRARHGRERPDRNDPRQVWRALPSRTVATEPPVRASDSLMTQVNRDNVLQVRNVLRHEVEAMLPVLQRANVELQLPPCGGDPISADATPMFQRKIVEVVRKHWAHYAEIREAVDRLTDTARDYGYTDEEITASFARSQAAP